MGAGYRNDNRTFTKRALLLAGSIIVAGSLAPSPSAVEAGRFELVRESRAGARHPHLIEGKVADVLVRIGGSGSCSGTPITGTRYVVTAAHCVLDHNGDLQVRTVTRGDVTYTAVAVLIDTTYHERQTSQLDAAVLVME